ncbi:MAG: nucleotidyltransferase family protein [Eubacteriales bacterium]|nr:nucleotidyltransferase family protein [Eubacteriales bacterium]
MQKEIDKTGADMLYLITCALHSQTPYKDKVCGMDIATLYRYAKRHTLAAITYDALELLGESTGDGLYALAKDDTVVSILTKWKETRDKALRKNLMLDVARKKLFQYMDAEHIWYMPLKGAILKELYPRQEMRQMADNDVLFDATCEAAVKDYFVKEGYEVISYAKGNHDVYEKEPVYNFEMHTSLFGEAHNEIWAEYYKDIQSKLNKSDNHFQYSFTDEDFYIYFIVHAFKHFDGCGTGIRYFVDSYVYQNAKNLDWGYIEEELDKLGVLAFEKTFRSVSMKIFGKGEDVSQLSEEEYSMLCDSMFAGTYGNLQSGVEKKLHKMQGNEDKITNRTKMKYYMSRLFPPMSFIKAYHPLVYRIKIIIPLFIVFRMVRGVLINGKKLMKEAKMVLKE